MRPSQNDNQYNVFGFPLDNMENFLNYNPPITPFFFVFETSKQSLNWNFFFVFRFCSALYFMRKLQIVQPKRENISYSQYVLITSECQLNGKPNKSFYPNIESKINLNQPRLKPEIMCIKRK